MVVQGSKAARHIDLSQSARDLLVFMHSAEFYTRLPIYSHILERRGSGRGDGRVQVLVCVVLQLIGGHKNLDSGGTAPTTSHNPDSALKPFRFTLKLDLRRITAVTVYVYFLNFIGRWITKQTHLYNIFVSYPPSIMIIKKWTFACTSICFAAIGWEQRPLYFLTSGKKER